jgi:hypothetical protein
VPSLFLFSAILKGIQKKSKGSPALLSASSSGVRIQCRHQSPLSTRRFTGICPYHMPSPVDLKVLPTRNYFLVLPFHSIMREAAASPLSLSLCSTRAAALPLKLLPGSRAQVQLATTMSTSLTPFLRMGRTQP